MKITNPTKEDITVVIGGVTYTVEAESSLSGVKEEHASYWKDSLHNFIEISEEVKIKKEEVKVIEEVEEEVKKVIKKSVNEDKLPSSKK